MPYTQTIQPQFRDADEDSLTGLRSCLRWFQDIHTWYMEDIDKDNDVLPERYGAAWVYTRYRLRVFHKLDYTDSATLTTWMEPYCQPALVKQNLLIHQHGVGRPGQAGECGVQPHPATAPEADGHRLS